MFHSRKAMTAFGSVALMFSTLCLSPGSAVATSSGQVPDATIGSLVESRLAHHGLDNVHATVHGGVVTLSGEVATLAQREAAARTADLREVDRVDNQVTLRPAQVTDAEIAAGVSRALDSYFFHGVFDWVEVKVQHGHVTLTGSVYQPWRRTVIADRMAGIAGVQAIDNQISASEVSGFDDQLRFQAARAVYGNLLFSEFAELSHPPVHILVDRGVITLEGTVRN